MVKVLIADDSTLIRERLIDMLSELTEIEIIGEAKDGQEAIDLVQELHPDVLILDIRMPRKNGIQVLQDIRKDKEFPIVIMLTNYVYPMYRAKCMKLGAAFFFDKSTQFGKIPEMLKQMASGLHI